MAMRKQLRYDIETQLKNQGDAPTKRVKDLTALLEHPEPIDDDLQEKLKIEINLACEALGQVVT